MALLLNTQLFESDRAEQVLAPLPVSCASLSKLVNIAEPQFTHL